MQRHRPPLTPPPLSIETVLKLHSQRVLGSYNQCVSKKGGNAYNVYQDEQQKKQSVL